MVVYIAKYDVIPGKEEAWAQWAQEAIPRILAAPGIEELTSHRPVTGSQRVGIIMRFASMEDWTAFWSDEDIQALRTEQWQYITNGSFELWDTSPAVPEPLRPSR